MKIVSRTEFLELPSNVLYCKYEPVGFYGDLAVKLDTVGNDWNYSELVEPDDENREPIEDWFALDAGKNVGNKCLENSARDGFYEDDEQYIVFDNDDIDNMMAAIASCKTKGDAING